MPSTVIYWDDDASLTSISIFESPGSNESIDNNPIIVPLLVEEKSYDYFKANKSKLCKIFLTEINFFYIDSLENNQIRCIANKKNYINLNFLKFVGPVDMSIIYREVFKYNSEDYIKLIYDL